MVSGSGGGVCEAGAANRPCEARMKVASNAAGNVEKRTSFMGIYFA